MQEPVSSPGVILFIDDDADVRRAASMLLGRRGFEVVGAASPAESWSVLATRRVDVILLDLNFSRGATSGEEGLAHLRALVAHDPDCVVVVVTGHSGIAIAVAAMRSGAADFVMKPWNNDRLVRTLGEAVSLARQRGAARPETAGPPPVIGQSAAMQRLMTLLHRAAPTTAPVLLAGERGTGKTLLAQTLHRHSMRSTAPLVTVDPGGEAAELARAMEEAEAGTLVLDDPGGMPAAAQMRLARMLEAHPGPRLVTCTRHAAPEYGMGADLLSRLDTVTLHLPPLADRAGDALLLAEHFTRQFAIGYGRPGLVLSPEAASCVAAWPWPGQVRELRHAIERAVVLAAGPAIEAADLALVSPGGMHAAEGATDLNLARSERAVVEAALRRHAFNVSHAARDLGVTRATLYRRMARHGL